jgi:superfamily II DNA/RNA helicase
MNGPKRHEALEVWRATWLLRGMDEAEPSVSFTHLGLNPTLVRAAERAGYTEPSAVQVAVVPAVLAGRDVRVRAETGSGKTAAFALPLLQLLLEQQSARSTERPETKRERRGNPVAVLVLVPTRELAIQIADVMTRLNGETTARLRILAVYGGVSVNPQMLSLRGGADVLVATPGRLLDLHRQGAVSFGMLGTLVLDEADRMLSLGFNDELTEITSLLPAARQNLLLSATYPRKLSALTESLLKDPVIVDLAPTVTETAIAQHAYVVAPKHKVKLLIHLIDVQQLPQVLVFVSAKKTADSLRNELNGADMPAAVLHGDRSQA